MAVTKIAAGSWSGAGTLLKGRVRSATSTAPNRAGACAPRRGRDCAAAAASWAPKSTASSPSTSITTDCSTRRAPRLTAATVPPAGDV
jgi:hypothetical protein